MTLASLLKYPLGALVACAAVLYLGWVKFFFDGAAVYYLDYLFRAACLVLLVSGGLAGAFRLPSHPLGAVVAGAVTLGLILALVSVERFLWSPEPWLYNHLYPPLDEGPLYRFDLTIGLALVAVSEEAVFRHLFVRVWVERKGSPLGLYAASSVAFGLLHLPQGLASVVFAALAGLVLMWLYRRTGSLWPPVVVHYLVNLVVFSDLACLWELGGPCAW